MKDVIELARQADALARKELKCAGYHARWNEVRDKYFAALVRNAALEDAAQICDAEQAKNEEKGQWLWEAKKSAAAIRQLKDNT